MQVEDNFRSTRVGAILGHLLEKVLHHHKMLHSKVLIEVLGEQMRVGEMRLGSKIVSAKKAE